GAALVTPGAWTPAAVVDVAVTADELPGELMLHAGSAAVPVRVRPLGDTAARLTLARPLPLHVGDRMLLRDPGRHLVVSGVRVLDVDPPPLRRRGAAAARAAVLAGLDGRPDGASELARRGAVPAARLRAMGVPEPAGALRAGDWLVDPGQAAAWRTALVTAVAAHAAGHPLEHGLPVEAARRRVGLPDARLVPLLAGLGPGLELRDGRVVADGGLALPAELRVPVETVLADLARAPFGAPEAHRLAELGLGRRELAAAVRVGALLRVADGVYLRPGAEAEAAAVLAGIPQPFTLSEARQALGTSRRVAVPLLELLDARGLTRRDADARRTTTGHD
ncbi:MAG TPA: SelB C-terminal domain-containing protein, partial [Mycobacteriales bacterium]|nr:SelB C-terminal domain-containing protein [Mycobacteriales bacterium]